MFVYVEEWAYGDGYHYVTAQIAVSHKRGHL